MTKKNLRKRRLYHYLRFYNTYPEIVRSLTAQSQKLLLSGVQKEAPPKLRSAPALSVSQLIDSLSYTLVRLQIPAAAASQRRFDAADRNRTPTTL